MRKFSFIFVCLLYLCVNTAWATDISWTGETISTSSAGFYLYNVGQGLFLNPTSPFGVSTAQYKWVFESTTAGTITTQYNNSTYYIYVEDKVIGSSAEIRTNPANPQIQTGTTTNSYRFYHTRNKTFGGTSTRYFNLESATQVTAANNTGFQNDWFLVGQTQYNNHVALVAYDAANTTASSYLQGSSPHTYPTATWTQIQNYLNTTTDYLNYSSWLTTTDKSSAINAATTYLTTTAPAVATAYAAALEYISAAHDTLALGVAGDAYDTYEAAISTAEPDVENATTVAEITSAISTLKSATRTFLEDSYPVVKGILEGHIDDAEELAVQFNTLTSCVATARNQIGDDENYGALDLLTIDETLQGYISVAESLIASSAYSTYTTKLATAQGLAGANEVNTTIDGALYTAISTAQSDLLNASLASVSAGTSDISSINPALQTAIDTYNGAISSKSAYLTKRGKALDLSNDVATATGINGVLTGAVTTQDAVVAAAAAASTIDGATGALQTAIDTYTAALPRYNYALQQVEVAERSGYDASTNRSNINAATSASAINTLISTLRTAAKTYITSNASAGMDVTIFIENNSFESGTTEGWTLSGTSGDTDVKSQSNPTYTTEGCDGEYLFNTLHEDSYLGNKFYEGEDLSQTISSLPKGYYRINVNITSDESNVVYLKVGNTDIPLTTVANSVFASVSYVFTIDANADINIKVYGEEKTVVWPKTYKVWYKADNFTLQFLGANPYQSYAMNIIANSSIGGFDKSSYATTISGTTDEDAIETELNSFRSNAISHVITNSAVGQNVTFLLENPDFEYLADWNYGWSGTTDDTNDGDNTVMSAYQCKVDGSNTYAWMHRQNSGTSERTLNAGNIYQAITLPAGTYKVTSDIEATSNDNNAGVTVTFYVKNGETILASKDIAMTRNSSFNNQALIFSLTEETTVTIGASHSLVKNSSRKTVAVDNFKLYYWETAKQKDLVDGYAMLYSSNKNIRIDDTDAKVYSATWNEDTDNPVVTLNEDPFGGASERIIEAGKVVLIYNSTKPAKLNYSHTATTATDEITDNLFVHHDGEATSYTNYVLGKQGDDDVAFHRFTGDESELENYNVLQLPISPTQAPSAVRIVTEGDTATALMPVYEENSAAAGQKANSKKIFIDGHLYIQQGNNLYDALGRKVQ